MRAADPTTGMYRMYQFCIPTAPGDPPCCSKTFDPFFSLRNHDLHSMCNFQSNKITSNPHYKSDSVSYRDPSSGESKGKHAKSSTMSLYCTCWPAQRQEAQTVPGFGHAVVNSGSKALLSRKLYKDHHPAQDENILATEQHCSLKSSKVRAKAYIQRKRKK